MALNLPLLWSHVDFTIINLAGAAETLARAKSAPLYLAADISRQRWDSDRFRTFQKELQAHVPHICHLRISAAQTTRLHKTLGGLVSPAPNLEHLSLSSTKGNRRRRSLRGHGRSSMPDTLFNNSTPRLSRLELRNCNISWKSPLLKGLKYLEIVTLSTNARPELAVWLAALDEMPQLTTLTLHSASPIVSPSGPPPPLVAKRTVTLASLTRLDISGSPGDCALALTHLDLPVLTWLCITPFTSDLLVISGVQMLLPFIVRHVHGPQDTQPLQTVFIRSEACRADVLAWPAPNIQVDIAVRDLPTLLTATPPTRVALSFRSHGWLSPENRLEILDMVMTCLPLDDLVMLAAHDLSRSRHEEAPETQNFWHRLSPMWTMLQCVRLSPAAADGFVAMLLEDNGGRHERPLLPSLTQLVMVGFSFYSLASLPLFHALMKRVKEGVPVKILDLRMCRLHPDDPALAEPWLDYIGEIVDVLHPETSEAMEQIESIWDTVAHGPFVSHDDSSESYRSNTDDEDSEE